MTNVAFLDANTNTQTAHNNKSRKISDRLFVDHLRYTKTLIYFLIRRQVDLSKQEADFNALATLGTVKYSPNGQPASPDDWRLLYLLSHNFNTQLIQAGLTNSFAIWQTRAVYGTLPFLFIISALIALALAFFNPKIMWLVNMGKWDWISFFIAIFLWTFSLDGLGVSAFFGTSLLSRLESEDVTDIREKDKTGSQTLIT